MNGLVWGLAAGVAVVLGLWLLGPYEPIKRPAPFDLSKLAKGVDAYLAQAEASFGDIREDSQKRVIWAGQPDMKTDWVVVYFHGFSASSQEIRPVPDLVAQALGANLVFTRFAGHGRDGAAMAEGSASDWMQDAADALAIARHIGERTLLIGTSTGASIATLALEDPEIAQNVEAIVHVSPNFAPNNPAAPLLTWPAARYWLPLIAGRNRSFDPANDGQAREWTSAYPSVAVFPMAAVAEAARNAAHVRINTPALFLYDPNDQVVRADVTDQVVTAWGGSTKVMRPPALQEGMDPYAHVIAGDILSPAGTAPAVKEILDWIGTI